MYYVYVHTTPTGKKYIGKAKDLRIRWNNGEGYSENKEFYKDITTCGWDNIKHEVIAEMIDNESAAQLEAVLIALLKTENPEYGYNQTKIHDEALKKYASRVSIDDPKKRDYEKATSFFEQFGLPISVCKDAINQWIFSDEHRKIAMDRLIDDMTINDLSKKYGKSERQIKYIIRTCEDKLEKHL